MAETPEPAKDGRSDWELALAVGNLPLDQVELVLRAIESDQQRWHEYRLRELHLIRVRELELAEGTQKRNDQLALVGITAGFVIAVGMMAVAVIAILKHQPTVAAVMAGPSAAALVATFVVRRSGGNTTDEKDRATSAKLGAPVVPAAMPDVGSAD